MRFTIGGVISLILTIIIACFLLVGLYDYYEYEKICERETVCYYTGGGGVFSQPTKIYIDCDNNNIPSREVIKKDEVCK